MKNFYLIEVFIIILYFLTLFLIRKDKYKVKILSLATIFAIIFENFNIYLSRNDVGGYFYNTNFIFYAFDTPLFVILSWGMIILSAMLISDKLKIKEKYKPFIDAVLVLSIDLSVDTIAIREKLWFWNQYRLTEGFFGVPANNFIGWLLVAFVFCYVFRYLQEKKIKNELTYYAIPVISYVIFLFLFYFVDFIEKIFKLTKFTELYLVLGLIVLFIIVGTLGFDKRKTKRENNYLIHLIRIPFHIYAFYGLITMRIENEWILWITAIVVLLVDIVLTLRTKRVISK
ncbi:MAG: carotenoid biosynthesis protein [Nanoarchaeota archaeon]